MAEANTGAMTGAVATPQTGSQPALSTAQTGTIDQQQSAASLAATVKSGASVNPEIPSGSVASLPKPTPAPAPQPTAAVAKEVEKPVLGGSTPEEQAQWKDAGSMTEAERIQVEAQMKQYPGLTAVGALGNVRMQKPAFQSVAPISTPQTKTAVEQMGAAPGGVVTTDSYRTGADAVKSMVDTAKQNPLPQTDPNAKKVMDVLQKQMTDLETYITDPEKDPQSQMIEKQREALKTRTSYYEQTVRAKTEHQIEGQKKSNEQALARAKVMFANLGTPGSSQYTQYLNDTIAEGEAALQAIRDEEAMLIAQAEMAYNEGDIQLSAQKVQLAENRRKEYNGLAMQNFQVQQAAQEWGMKQIQFAAQMKQYEREDLTQSVQMMIAGGMKSAAFAPQTMVDRINESIGAPTGSAAGRFWIDSMIDADKASKAKTEQEQTKAAIDLNKSIFEFAEKVEKGKTITLPLGNGQTVTIDGSKDPFKEWDKREVKTPDGQFVVWSDPVTKKQVTVKVGENYVSPTFDSDTGQWKTYNPLNHTETVTFNAGEYGEGVHGMSTAKGYVDQISKKYKVTQEPGEGFSHKNLTGWDIAMPQGTTIKPPQMNGVVVSVNHSDRNIDPHSESPSHSNDDYGNFVDVMDVDTGAIYRFAHLAEINVSLKDNVTGDSILGKSGNTGYSTGGHLHFEVRDSNNRPVTPNAKAPSAAIPVSSAPTAAKGSEISQFEEDTGYKYNPGSKRSQDKFAEWKGEQRKEIKEEKKVAQDKEKLIQQNQKDLSTNEQTKLYNKAFDSFGVISTAVDQVIKNPKTAGVNDLAILTAYARSLDPNTGVRDQEFNNMASALGELQRLGMLPEKWFKGSRLTDEGRKNFASAAKSQFEGRQKEYFNTVALEINNARANDYDPSRTIPPRILDEYKKVNGIRMYNPTAPINQRTIAVLDEQDPDYQEALSMGYQVQ